MLNNGLLQIEGRMYWELSSLVGCKVLPFALLPSEFLLMSLMKLFWLLMTQIQSKEESLTLDEYSFPDKLIKKERNTDPNKILKTTSIQLYMCIYVCTNKPSHSTQIAFSI